MCDRLSRMKQQDGVRQMIRNCAEKKLFGPKKRAVEEEGQGAQGKRRKKQKKYEGDPRASVVFWFDVSIHGSSQPIGRLPRAPSRSSEPINSLDLEPPRGAAWALSRCSATSATAGRIHSNKLLSKSIFLIGPSFQLRAAHKRWPPADPVPLRFPVALGESPSPPSSTGRGAGVAGRPMKTTLRNCPRPPAGCHVTPCLKLAGARDNPASVWPIASISIQITDPHSHSTPKLQTRAHRQPTAAALPTRAARRSYAAG